MKTASPAHPPLLPWGIKLVLVLIGVMVVYVAGRIPAEQRARQAELAAQQHRQIAVRAEQTASTAAKRAEEALQHVKQALERIEELNPAEASDAKPRSLPTVAATLERVQDVGDVVLQWAIYDAPLPVGERMGDPSEGPVVAEGDELNVRFPAAEVLRSALVQGQQTELFIAWNEDGIGSPWESIGWKYDLSSRQVAVLISDERTALAESWSELPIPRIARFRVERLGPRKMIVHFAIGDVGGGDLTFEESTHGLQLTAISTHVL